MRRRALKTGHCLFLIIALFSSVVASAHEEPNKTLWEKEQSNQTRMRVSVAGICAATLWRRESQSGQLSPKVRIIRQEYSAKGELILISAFHNDSVTVSAAYSYNPDGEMVSDLDLTPGGRITEATFFTYDDRGRVLSGFAVDSTGRSTGRFMHRFDRDRHHIEFIKYGGMDTVDYTIIYNYPGDYDTCDYISAVKKNRGVDTVLSVTKTLDPQGRTITKAVRDKSLNKTFSFRYVYDQNNVLTELTKHLGDGTIESRSTYLCNDDGTYAEVKTTDGKGQLLRVTTYEYEHTRIDTPGRSRQ
jgi:hypothetical protein